MERDAPAHDGASPVGRYWRGLRRGFARRCPACGAGSLYRGYVKVHDHCPSCAGALSVFRADDAPAYFTILIVGHLVVPGALMLERLAAPAMWVQWALWLPLTLGLALALLPRIKGAIIGVHWAVDVTG